jgi:hypothetical protein
MLGSTQNLLGIDFCGVQTLTFLFMTPYISMIRIRRQKSTFAISAAGRKILDKGIIR